MALVPISEIVLDPRLQMRSKMDFEAIDDYAENASRLPPGKIVRGPNGEMWLTGGWHRYHANVKTGAGMLVCEVRDGTFQDALIEAAGENADHGIKRTPKDKRRAVLAILKDKELAQRSNRMIADICRVSDALVATIREEKNGKKSTARNRSSTRVGADGRERPAQNTGPNPANEAKKKEKIASFGCPELQKAVEAGDVKLADAVTICKAKIPHGMQVLALEKVKAGEHKTLAVAMDAIIANKKATKAQVLCERCKQIGYQPECGACAHIAERDAKKEMPLVDDAGEDVPDDFRLVFLASPKFLEANRLLTKLAHLVKAIEESPARRKKPLDPSKPFEKFFPVMKNLRWRVKMMKPALVCKDCLVTGVHRECACCQGDGWLSVEEHEAIKKGGIPA